MNNTSFIYDSHNEKNIAQAVKYNKTSENPFRFLAYRDLSKLIERYCIGKKALDYGSGTGISSQELIKQGFDVIGADISKEMLKQSRINCPDLSFHLIEDNLKNLFQSNFDLVFSSFVLFEIGSKSNIVKYLKEAKSVMKEGGVFIGITGSESLYNGNWLAWETNFPCNKDLKSGDKAKLLLKHENIEFTDFFWKEVDYRDCFKIAGLNLLEIYYPLGMYNEPFQWKDEILDSPFVYFIAQ